MAAGLRQAIRQGLLKRHFRLPAVRQLAQDLGVSRHVVANAYERLETEGYVAAKRGCGTFVTADAVTTPRVAAPLEPSMRSAEVVARNADADEVPARSWQRAFERAARNRRDLRQTIAEQLCPRRGVLAAAEEIVVAVSREEAVSAAARLLADPGQLVQVNDPEARAIYEQHGLRCIEERSAFLPRIVHVHAPMEPGQQYLLLQWATTMGAAVVEDEHEQRPMKALDNNGRVVHIGRCFGVVYMVLPAQLAVIAARMTTALPQILQSAIAELIVAGETGPGSTGRPPEPRPLHDRNASASSMTPW